MCVCVCVCLSQNLETLVGMMSVSFMCDFLFAQKCCCLTVIVATQELVCMDAASDPDFRLVSLSFMYENTHSHVTRLKYMCLPSYMNHASDLGSDFSLLSTSVHLHVHIHTRTHTHTHTHALAHSYTHSHAHAPDM